MATAIPDLWPEGIKIDVQPPVAILKAQVSYLVRNTSGLLQAEVQTTYGNQLVEHNLDLIAPSLGYYRERLLSARHDMNRIYPVTVAAECFRPLSSNPLLAARERGPQPPYLADNERIAATDDEFIQLLRAVLQSPEVKSLILSLIARINENAPAQGVGGTAGE